MCRWEGVRLPQTVWKLDFLHFSELPQKFPVTSQELLLVDFKRNQSSPEVRQTSPEVPQASTEVRPKDKSRLHILLGESCCYDELVLMEFKVRWQR